MDMNDMDFMPDYLDYNASLYNLYLDYNVSYEDNSSEVDTFNLSDCPVLTVEVCIYCIMLCYQK